MISSIGSIKWFGGFNRKKNKENDFGFITDVEGVDVYLHLSGWSEDDVPSEDDIVVYSREEKGGKWKANSASLLSSSNPPLDQVLDWVSLSGYMNDPLSDSYDMGKQLVELVAGNPSSYSISDLKEGIEKHGVTTLIEYLVFDDSDWIDLFNLLEEHSILNPIVDMEWSEIPDENYIKNNESKVMHQMLAMEPASVKVLIRSNIHEVSDYLLECLFDEHVIDPIVDLDWNTLPAKYSIANNESKVADRLLSMGDGVKGLVTSNYRMLTPPLKMLASFAGLIDDQELLGKVVDDVSPFVRSVYHREEALPDFLKGYIDEYVKPKGGVMKDPVLGGLFILCQFKKYLYDKNVKFVALYESSDYLQSRFDAFVLKEIFSLLLAGNSVDQVYSLFLNKLWGGITSGQLNPTEQLDQILDVFPSCNSFSRGLSCEAVYWKKQDMFLCRGRPCHTPKVQGQAGPNYLTFSIYDWFVHYGINYFEDGAPSHRDFPIKLAGYINRIREIFDVIHCRSCQSLMLPNMTYARVDYTVYEKGQLVKKDMAPAYRLTVFKCPSEQCIEAQNEYYINHCYGCNKIIDSRDCKTKCDAGLYICKSCASCCSDHSQTNPVGLCPACTSPLQLFETKYPHRFRKTNERYVKCSKQSCSFNIPTDELDKRFYLDSCGPVMRKQDEDIVWGP